MNLSKSLFFFLFVILFSSSILAVNTYNSEGDFSIEVESQKVSVYNDNIAAHFDFKVKNLKNFPQDFEIVLKHIPGWDIDLSSDNFLLNRNEEKTITVTLNANSDFDYTANVVSPDVVKISQKSEYVGFFEFPLSIRGASEDISLKFEIAIDKKDRTLNFIPKLATQQLSPMLPLRYTITAENLQEPTDVFIRVELGNEVLAEFTDTLSEQNNYKIYEVQVPVTFEPGSYNAKLTARVSESDGKAFEWFETRNLDVIPYQDLVVDENFENGWIKDTYTISIINNGNEKDTFIKDVPFGFFRSMLFGTNTQSYVKTSEGITYIVDLEKGQKMNIVYSFNYIALYILIIALLSISLYVYVRKTSNPLDIETKIYDITRVEHEGVKSLKLRIGFENIKEEEIDELKIIFRMPSYLQVKDNSFSVVEPKHVLKGKNQFKLIWDFKRFERFDSRIIGFALVNSKGVLGDIKIPEVEFEVKVKGKVRKYYASFPIIRG